MHVLFLSPDSTVTTLSLAQLLMNVRWYGEGGLHVFLHISYNVYDAITEQATSQTETVNQLCEWYVENHPAPSWEQVAESLYYWGEHEALEVLRDEIPSLKGECYATGM